MCVQLGCEIDWVRSDWGVGPSKPDQFDSQTPSSLPLRTPPAPLNQPAQTHTTSTMSPIALSSSAPSSSGSAAVLVIGSLELGAEFQSRVAQAESEGIERVDKYMIDRIVDGGESNRLIWLCDSW